MSAENRQSVREIFANALELKDPAERERYLKNIVLIESIDLYGVPIDADNFLQDLIRLAVKISGALLDTVPSDPAVLWKRVAQLAHWILNKRLPYL